MKYDNRNLKSEELIISQNHTEMLAGNIMVSYIARSEGKKKQQKHYLHRNDIIVLTNNFGPSAWTNLILIPI